MKLFLIKHSDQFKAILTFFSIALFLLVSGKNIYEIGYSLLNIRVNSEARNIVSPLFNGLFNFSILITIFLIVMDKIKVWYLGIGLLISMLGAYYDVLENIHTFLVNNKLHPLLLILSKDQLFNQQITKAILALLVYGIFIIVLLKKNRRSFDRKFFFIIVSVVFATTFLFHKLTANILIVQDKNIVSNLLISALNNKKQPDLSFLENMNVLIFEKVDKEIIALDGIAQFPSISPEKITLVATKLIQSNEIYLEFFFSNGLNKENFIIAGKNVNNKIYFYVLQEPINTLVIRDEVWFFILCLMAHTTWIFGGIMLWSYHKYLFNKRLIENNIKD